MLNVPPQVITLYHTGYQEIREPGIRHGRKNADFGQGFYLTPDRDFSERWGKERKGESVCVNVYRLNVSGLRVRRLERDAEWLGYILGNRRGQPDAFADADVIIGPIANDTLFDTLGIISSGFLSDAEALRLLSIGPAYTQAVIKTEKAAAQLVWQETNALSSENVRRWDRVLAAEEKTYMEAFAAACQAMEEETESAKTTSP